MNRPIALDATYSLDDELSGVGLYSREILHGLAEAHPDERFWFCYRPHRYWRSRSERLPPNVRRRLLADPLGPRSASLFHGLNQRLPNTRLRRAIATFHDLFVMTGEYSTPEFRARFTAQARDAATRADAIIAVSEFTRSQVIALLGVEPGKVSVVHHGTRRLSLPQGIPREKIVLTVGAIQKRKNIARLVEAFETMDPSWKLVIAGADGYGAVEIRQRIQQSSSRERILITGYISPEELAAWYAKSMVFAFPSLDEGFGMPLLEAMDAGIPIVTSNRSALPEVAGDAAILVNPEKTAEISDALQELSKNDVLRQELVRKGKLRAQLFTWEKAIRGTWSVYQAVLR